MDRREFLSLAQFIPFTQIPETPSRKSPVEDELAVPKLPSINDPFDLTLCNTLPPAMTEEEVRILQHILGITCSDYQMKKRAFDSIECMWKKRISEIPVEYPAPYITSIIPNSIYAGVPATITFNGGNFRQGIEVMKAGFVNNYTTFINSSQVTAPVNWPWPQDGIRMGVMNTDKKYSSEQPGNQYLIQVLPHPDMPRVSAVNPISASKAAGNTNIIITGSNFYPNAKIYMSNDPSGSGGSIISTTFVSSSQLNGVINWTFPIDYTAPSIIYLQVGNGITVGAGNPYPGPYTIYSFLFHFYLNP